MYVANELNAIDRFHGELPTKRVRCLYGMDSYRQRQISQSDCEPLAAIVLKIDIGVSLRFLLQGRKEAPKRAQALFSTSGCW